MMENHKAVGVEWAYHFTLEICALSKEVLFLEGKETKGNPAEEKVWHCGRPQHFQRKMRNWVELEFGIHDGEKGVKGMVQAGYIQTRL